jgi:hypothetical protein
MGLQPKLINRKGFTLKTCARCGQAFGVEGFAPTKSFFYPDGTLPTCNDCIDRELAAHDWDWNYVDKMC